MPPAKDDKKIILTDAELVTPETKPAPKRTREKQVTRNTLEVFSIPLDEEKEPESNQPADEDFDETTVELNPELELGYEEEEEDTFNEFLERFQDARGFAMQAVRYADKPTQNARVPCYELTPLPRLPFNPSTIISDIQKHNDYSGGYFKIQLLNQHGRYVADGSWTGIIPNPPEGAQHTEPQPNFTVQMPEQQKPQPTQGDAVLAMMNNLYLKRMEKSLEMLDNPPQVPPAPPPAPMLPSSDPLSLLMPHLQNNAPLAEKLVDRLYPGESDSIWKEVFKHPGEAATILQAVVGSIEQLFFRRKDAKSKYEQFFAVLNPIRPLIDEICGELVNNSELTLTLNSIRQLIVTQPQYAPMIGLLASMSSSELIVLLSEYTNQPLLIKVKWGAAWIEALQFELKAGLRPPPEAPQQSVEAEPPAEEEAEGVNLDEHSEPDTTVGEPQAGA